MRENRKQLKSTRPSVPCEGLKDVGRMEEVDARQLHSGSMGPCVRVPLLQGERALEEPLDESLGIEGVPEPGRGIELHRAPPARAGLPLMLAGNGDDVRAEARSTADGTAGGAAKRKGGRGHENSPVGMGPTVQGGESGRLLEMIEVLLDEVGVILRDLDTAVPHRLGDGVDRNPLREPAGAP